ncbi:hypothetical protein FB45DRAFT_874609 [Roridomyces roridus]|uniref:Uncharacterized protein n=1 Tax=Roridomyces roridus TaxID=1738132 RepID=A0AAD7B853_9AGAR|nr:hypothetical protein FB45DRAFT_874609 [Roridomyces roridus]
MLITVFCCCFLSSVLCGVCMLLGIYWKHRATPPHPAFFSYRLLSSRKSHMHPSCVWPLPDACGVTCVLRAPSAPAVTYSHIPGPHALPSPTTHASRFGGMISISGTTSESASVYMDQGSFAIGKFHSATAASTRGVRVEAPRRHRRPEEYHYHHSTKEHSIWKGIVPHASSKLNSELPVSWLRFVWVLHLRGLASHAPTLDLQARALLRHRNIQWHLATKRTQTRHAFTAGAGSFGLHQKITCNELVTNFSLPATRAPPAPFLSVRHERPASRTGIREIEVKLRVRGPPSVVYPRHFHFHFPSPTERIQNRTPPSDAPARRYVLLIHRPACLRAGGRASYRSSVGSFIHSIFGFLAIFRASKLAILRLRRQTSPGNLYSIAVSVKQNRLRPTPRPESFRIGYSDSLECTGASAGATNGDAPRFDALPESKVQVDKSVFTARPPPTLHCVVIPARFGTNQYRLSVEPAIETPQFLSIQLAHTGQRWEDGWVILNFAHDHSVPPSPPDSELRLIASVADGIADIIIQYCEHRFRFSSRIHIRFNTGPYISILSNSRGMAWRSRGVYLLEFQPEYLLLYIPIWHVLALGTGAGSDRGAETKIWGHAYGSLTPGTMGVDE